MSADASMVLVVSVSEDSVWLNIVIESRDPVLSTPGRLALQVPTISPQLASQYSGCWEI